MNTITKDEINIFNNIGDKIDTRIRQLLQLRDYIPNIAGWFIKDDKIFVEYKPEYTKDINYKPEYEDRKYKVIYWDLDYFLSSDRDKEYKLYLEVKKDSKDL